MSAGGSMQSMNSMINNNRLLLTSKEKQRSAYREAFHNHLKKHDLEFKKATPEELERIKMLLRKDLARQQKKRVIALLASIIISPIVVYYLFKLVIWAIRI